MVTHMSDWYEMIVNIIFRLMFWLIEHLFAGSNLSEEVHRRRRLSQSAQKVPLWWNLRPFLHQTRSVTHFFLEWYLSRRYWISDMMLCSQPGIITIIKTASIDFYRFNSVADHVSRNMPIWNNHNKVERQS